MCPAHPSGRTRILRLPRQGRPLDADELGEARGGALNAYAETFTGSSGTGPAPYSCTADDDYDY